MEELFLKLYNLENYILNDVIKIVEKWCENLIELHSITN